MRVDSARELAAVRVEMAREQAVLRTEMAQGFSASRAALTQSLEQVRQEIATAHVSSIRWMFLFWTGQLAVVVALVMALRR